MDKSSQLCSFTAGTAQRWLPTPTGNQSPRGRPQNPSSSNIVTTFYLLTSSVFPRHSWLPYACSLIRSETRRPCYWRLTYYSKRCIIFLNHLLAVYFHFSVAWSYQNPVLLFCLFPHLQMASDYFPWLKEPRCKDRPLFIVVLLCII